MNWNLSTPLMKLIQKDWESLFPNNGLRNYNPPHLSPRKAVDPFICFGQDKLPSQSASKTMKVAIFFPNKSHPLRQSQNRKRKFHQEANN